MIRATITRLSARTTTPVVLRQPRAYQATRLFSSTQLRAESKGPIETAKDALKSVDRAVSNAAVKGIETGEQVANSTKEAVGDVTGNVASKTSGAQGTAAGTADQASGKASELAGQAKGKAAELTGEAKGKAQEVKGKVQGEVNKL